MGIIQDKGRNHDAKKKKKEELREQKSYVRPWQWDPGHTGVILRWEWVSSSTGSRKKAKYRGR